MGVTEQFANWIVSTRFEDIPAKGMETVKQSVLDWIGCALAGSVRKEACIVVDFTREQGGTPQSRLIAFGDRTSSANAALANGVMGHLEDFDDSGAHPASYLTPMVLALGEELHLSGSQILLAWALGFDISSRIGSGLHPDRAWHTTPLFGTMGAAAGASKLAGLDVNQTRMAFGIAASETSGLMRNFGTMTKSFHPGNAARSAIVAAKLAGRGFGADPDIIEARYGYADCFGGEKCYLPAMTQFLGSVWHIAAKGPDVKVWPCCSSNHQTLTGIMKFLHKQAVDAGNIERIEHYGPDQPGAGALQGKQVHTGFEGKFSLEYNIAAAFIDKKVDLATFSDARLMRGDLQSFMAKVHRYQDPEAALHSSRTRKGHSAAWLRVTMKNGNVHEIALGSRDTLKGEAVVEKFRANAGLALDRDTVERVVTMVRNLEKMADINVLMDVICGKDGLR